jgi:hypothetical protein
MVVLGTSGTSLIGGGVTAMPNTPTRFLSEVIDIADQLTQLSEHRQGLLQACTMSALDTALERVEQSVDILKACVTVLKYNVGLQVHRRSEH